MLTDEQLLEESRQLWQWAAGMSEAHEEMTYAIDAYMGGADVDSWRHLFEWALSRDEAREMLREMCMGGR